jgi:transportin-1
MLAGLLLKNSIKEHYHLMPEDVRQYIKSEIVPCIGDPKASVRKTVASIITTIVVKSSFKAWPGLLQTLVQFLDSTDQNYVEGALNVFVLICEDYADKLDADEPSSTVRPLNVLIPKFISFFKSPNETYRRYALSCINQFIVDLPPALLVNMELYLQVKRQNI